MSSKVAFPAQPSARSRWSGAAGPGKKGGFRRLGRRLRTHWVFKTTAMTLFSAIFFAGYFLLLKFPAFTVTQMPLTALDRWIPFQPAALLPYVSLWVYVPLAPGLLEDQRELLTYYGAMIALALAGLAVFFLW